MSHIIDQKRLEALKKRYLDGDLDRRSFLGLVGFAGIAAGVLGGPLKAFAQATDVKQIKFDSWGGVVSEALRKTGVAAFEKATSIKVVEGTFGLEEEILAKAKAVVHNLPSAFTISSPNISSIAPGPANLTELRWKR